MSGLFCAESEIEVGGMGEASHGQKRRERLGRLHAAFVAHAAFVTHASFRASYAAVVVVVVAAAAAAAVVVVVVVAAGCNAVGNVV